MSMDPVKWTLTSGHEVTVDAEDWARVAQRSWAVSPSEHRLYVVTNVTKPDGSRTTMKLHRFLLGALPTQLVDHINRNGLDNRRCNLRVCNNAQNGANARLSKANKSGYRGVHWVKARGVYLASITVDRRSRYLGTFIDPWEAAQAYNAAATTEWGPFAYQNVRISGKQAA